MRRISLLALLLSACGHALPAQESAQLGADCKGFEREIAQRFGPAKDVDGTVFSARLYGDVWVTQREAVCADFTLQKRIDAREYQRDVHCLDDALAALMLTEAELAAKQTEAMAKLPAITERIDNCRKPAMNAGYSASADEPGAKSRPLLQQARAELGQGNPRAALELARRALAEPDHASEVALHVEILLTQARAQTELGQYDEARAAAHDAEQRAKAAGYARGEADAVSATALSYALQGELDTAVARYRAAIAVYDQSGLDVHHVKAALLTQIGTLQTDASQAIAICSEALTVLDAAPRGNPLARAEAASCIGMGHATALRWDEALVWFEKAFAEQKSLLGPRHVTTAQTGGQIGSCHAGKDDYKTALGWLAPAVDILFAAGRENQPAVLGFAMQLGYAQLQAGEFAAAAAVLERAVAAGDRYLGSAHPVTLGCAMRLGYAYVLQRDFERGKRIFGSTLEVLLSARPDEQFIVVNLLALGMIAVELGDFEIAFDLYDKAIRRLSQAPTPDEELMLDAQAAKESATCRAGRGSTVDKLGEIMRKQTAQFGEYTSSASDTMLMTGQCFAKLGRLNDALKWYQKALYFQKQPDGTPKPDTSITRYEIGRLCERGHKAACASLTQAPSP